MKRFLTIPSFVFLLLLAPLYAIAGDLAAQPGFPVEQGPDTMPRGMEETPLIPPTSAAESDVVPSPDLVSVLSPTMPDTASPGHDAKTADAMPSRDEETAGKSPEYGEEEEIVTIPDPFRPWNTAMYHVNDKLYFWLLEPVTQVYVHTVPEPFRIVLNNFYDNLRAPRRMANHLFQMNFKSAGNELIRFLFNSFAGIGGLGDVAKDSLGIKKQEADFGQTLGHYGIGHGFYLVWPLFGPSSLRDTVGLVGDRFLYPLSYVSSNEISFEASAAILGHEIVNRTSFKLGDYESFKDAAIDPYVSMRDAYAQHRERPTGEKPW